MSSNSEPPAIDVPKPGIVSIDPEREAEDWEEASGVARIWVWIVPVAMAHLALIYALVSRTFDFKLPAYLHSDLIFAWLWVNGAAVGLGAWFWKKGRIPVAAGKWLHGRRVRWLILIWLGSSLAWFLLPAVLGDGWDMLSALLNDW